MKGRLADDGILMAFKERSQVHLTNYVEQKVEDDHR